MIKPDGYAAGVKRVELHPSGSWCNDRNQECGDLCSCLIKACIVHKKYIKHRICHPVTISGGGIM